MSDVIDLSRRRQLAEFHRGLVLADGATITQNIATAEWTVRDRDGTEVITGSLSTAEAAWRYCEDQNFVSGRDDEFLELILEQHQPYSGLPAFHEGYLAVLLEGAKRSNPYATRRSAQTEAWDFGVAAALVYQRALAAPNWLSQLLQSGRR